MIDIRNLERLNIKGCTSWNQVDGKYEPQFRGKLVVDDYSAVYFTEDGTQAQTLISCMMDYKQGGEIRLFDHKQFLDELCATYDSNPKRVPTTTPLDVELLIKLKQGGHTADELVILREAGII